MRVIRCAIFIFSSLFILLKVNAQNLNNNWYFGQNAGITFNTNPATSIPGGQINQIEGCASVSNSLGDLLFYTDGLRVWDKNHNVMPNGIGLMGHPSSTQSALIVPIPGSNSRYYIFTVTDWMKNGDLCYSIVDMSLNSGNGDVLPSYKNILLSTNQTEKLVAANSTNCGLWVLTHQRNNNKFEARLVTSNGINPPVISEVGSVHTSTPIPPDNYSNLTGVMKVSSNNLKIGLATLGRVIEIFDFNPGNGAINNPVSMPMLYPNQSYGVSFSPDNSKFYITESDMNLNAGYIIYQYDLSSGNSTTINESKTIVGRADLPTSVVGDLQIGPDGKIYFTKQDTRYLGIIPYPNLPAPACGFIDNGINLGSAYSKNGLPNEVRIGIGSFSVNLGNDTIICPGETVQISAPEASSYLWSNGITEREISVDTDGKYWVTVTNGACTSSDTIIIEVSIPEVNLGNDTTLCQGETILINGSKTIENIWSTGETSPFINVTKPGKYWVTVNNGNCFNTDTININFTHIPDVDIGSDTTLCEGQFLRLNAGSANLNVWSTGDTSQFINVINAGKYWVTSINGNCVNSDTVNIDFTRLPNVNLGNDTALCEGQFLRLNADAANVNIWSTGDTSQLINVINAGKYWVTSINGNCVNSDTVNIDFTRLPNINLGNDTTLCEGQFLKLNAGIANTYLWSTGSTSQTISVSSPGKYAVRGGNGSCFILDTINVHYKFAPIFTFPMDTTVCNDQEIKIIAEIADSYTWSTGDTTQVINVSKSGIYILDLTYFGVCHKRYSFTVSVESCECILYMPNVFTPNSDGLNDVFKPAKMDGCQFVSFSIFNRFGNLVFETTDLFKGWDGSINGVPQNSGVFAWVVSAIRDGQHKIYKGIVTLVR